MSKHRRTQPYDIVKVVTSYGEYLANVNVVHRDGRIEAVKTERGNSSSGFVDMAARVEFTQADVAETIREA